MEICPLCGQQVNIVSARSTQDINGDDCVAVELACENHQCSYNPVYRLRVEDIVCFYEPSKDADIQPAGEKESPVEKIKTFLKTEGYEYHAGQTMPNMTGEVHHFIKDGTLLQVIMDTEPDKETLDAIRGD